MLKPHLLALALCVASATAAAQHRPEKVPVDAATRKAVIAELSSQLKANYVFPDVATRLAELDESLRVQKLLWTADRPSFDGRFYRLREAWCEPRPAQRPLERAVATHGQPGDINTVDINR